MTKTINVGDRAVVFKATASTITRYSSQFNRDVFADINTAQKEAKDGKFTTTSLISILNLAFIMAKQADNSIPDNPEDWLDTFDVFPVEEVLPQVAELWAESMGATIAQKKA